MNMLASDGKRKYHAGECRRGTHHSLSLLDLTDFDMNPDRNTHAVWSAEKRVTRLPPVSHDNRSPYHPVRSRISPESKLETIIEKCESQDPSQISEYCGLDIGIVCSSFFIVLVID